MCTPGAATQLVTPLASLVTARIFMLSRSSTLTLPSPPPTTTSPVGAIALVATPLGTNDLCGPLCLYTHAPRAILSTSPEDVPTNICWSC